MHQIRHTILAMLCAAPTVVALCIAGTAEAQLFDRLRDRAEREAEERVDRAIDDDQPRDSSSADSSAQPTDRSPASSGDGVLRGTYTPLGKVDDLTQLRGVSRHLTKAFSPGGGAFAYAASSGSRRRMIVEGEAGPVVGDILLIEPAQTRPTKLSQRPDKALIVFSHDGDRHAYLIKKGNQRRLVLDGELTDTIAGETIRSVQFSDDGSGFAYCAPAAAPEGETGDFWSVVHDGEVLDTSPGVKFVVLNRDGSRIAYDTMHQSGRLVVDDVTIDNLRRVNRSEFLAGGRHLAVVHAYIEGKGGGTTQRVLIDGAQVGPDLKTGSGLFELVVSEQGKVAYVAEREEGGRVLVVEGELVAEDPGLEAVAISPDASRVAYVVDGQTDRRRRRSGGRQRVMSDGQAGREYDEIERLQFSPDGRSVAYAGKMDRVHYPVLDGRELAGLTRIDRFGFAPAGHRFCASGTDADNKTEVIIIDGELADLPSPAPEVVAFTFSPNGRHYAYAVKPRFKSTHIYLDGKPVAESTRPLTRHKVRPGHSPESQNPMSEQWFIWISDAGDKVLYTNNDGVFVNDTPVVEYNKDLRRVEDIVATPDLAHIGGVRSARNKAFVFLDGRITERCYDAMPAHFLPDGTLTAVVEKDGQFQRFTAEP